LVFGSIIEPKFWPKLEKQIKLKCKPKLILN